jgi:hypothetical protein
MKVIDMKIVTLGMQFYWIMVQFILESGLLTKSLEREFRSGRMVLFMKDSG